MLQKNTQEQGIRIELFESSLLFILIISLLRQEQVTSRLFMGVEAILIIIFIAISWIPIKKTLKLVKLRFAVFLGLVLMLVGFLTGQAVLSRLNNPLHKIHDGAIQTEVAYQKLLQGANPYSINYGSFLNSAADSYVYSPLTILINAPIFSFTGYFFHFFDIRITLIILFLLSALVILTIVRERILFLTLFLLNPLFLHSVLYGAKDVLMLFFLSLTLIWLKLNRITLATIMVGLGSATKLTFLPFVPLYFIYLYLRLSNNRVKRKLFFQQLGIFVATSALFYLPFAIWNWSDLYHDLVLYQFNGGDVGRPIAGFLGVPQLLNYFNFIPGNSSLPFYLILIPSSIIFLLYSFKYLKRSLNIRLLCLIYCGFLLLVLSFSRILQIDYLGYISEVLIIGAFILSEPIIIPKKT